jgi:hypothetical protein
VQKRLLVHASVFNLGLWMRTLFGIGTPRALQGRLPTVATVLTALGRLTHDAIGRRWRQSFPLMSSTPSFNKSLGCA